MGTGTARRAESSMTTKRERGKRGEAVGTEGLEDALTILPSFQHYPLRASLFESQQFSRNRWCPTRAPFGQSRVPESADSRGQRQVREPVIFPVKRVLLLCAEDHRWHSALLSNRNVHFSTGNPCGHNE